MWTNFKRNGLFDTCKFDSWMCSLQKDLKLCSSELHKTNRWWVLYMAFKALSRIVHLPSSRLNPQRWRIKYLKVGALNHEDMFAIIFCIERGICIMRTKTLFLIAVRKCYRTFSRKFSFFVLNTQRMDVFFVFFSLLSQDFGFISTR